MLRLMVAATLLGTLVACSGGGTASAPTASMSAMPGMGGSTQPATATPTATAPAAGSAPAAMSQTVTIKNFAYSPSTITVPKGGTVTFVNNDTAAHTATGDTAAFDTGNLDAGATSKPIPFNTAGSFPYHCTYHANMHGTITVQ